MNKNILITGGAGFIGSYLTEKLQKDGHRVTVLDNLSPQIHGNNPEKNSYTYKKMIHSGASFIQGCVTSREDWQKALSGQQVIIHLAAETGTGQSMYQIEKYTKVNSLGTALFLDILSNTSHSVEKIIVASSRAIYGEGKYECSVHGTVFPEARKEDDMSSGQFECRCPICDQIVQTQPTSEDSRVSPSSIYGISKLNQEQMVLTVGKSLQIPSIALRFQNVYGPGQSLSNPYTGILSIFSSLLQKNKPINIFEDGKETRDFVYIEDVVHSIMRSIDNNAVAYKAFNVGSGIATTVSLVAEILRNYYQSNSEITISGNYRIGDIRHNTADLSQVRSALNFSPSFSFETGVRKFCDWVKEQEIVDNNYEMSIKEMKAKGLFK